jgi:rod shape-determining protein MreD
MRNLVPIMMTIIIGLCLTLLPMPPWALWARPAWVLMILIFWTLRVPYEVNVGYAFFAGICLDILTGTMLGLHALAMTVVIHLVYRSSSKMNMYPLIQRILSVFMFVFIYQVIIYGIQGFIGEEPLSRYYWLSSVTSMLLWPWLAAMMRDYSRWVRIGLTK